MAGRLRIMVPLSPRRTWGGWRKQMADSSFWRNLAEKFSGLALILAALRADYYYTLGSGCAEWKLRGAQGGSVIHFETLARRGASALPGADGSELLQAWLEALKSV